MDQIKEKFEQGVGDRFAEWLSSVSGQTCSFLSRSDPAPDLMYQFRGESLFFEITGAYYDAAHATFLWQSAKGAPDADTNWVGVNPDQSLVTAIAKRVAEKSKKPYPRNTVLLIEVPPGVTTFERLSDLLVVLEKAENSFVGIYVVGTFPMSTTSNGGYRVLFYKELEFLRRN